MKTLIIAEAGVNHNGSIDLAFDLIDEAAKAGADIVKFQTFVAENLVSENAKKAEYQIQNTNNDNNNSQLDMLKKLELSFDDFVKLKEHCDKKHIKFLSTAFDLDSVEFLHTLNLKLWKIPSGEITNYPYLEKIGKYHEKVIISTGMAEIREIEDAINVLRDNGTNDITVLHCTTEYPAPYVDVNLKAMGTMRDLFGFPVGYSDHTKGIEIPIAAVSMGATVIEKHFTLNRNMEGPDHKASLEPSELKEMVDSIRNVERAIGDGRKRIADSERKNIYVARKSIFSKTAIKKGDVFSENNLTTKRPGNGISPMRWKELLGKTSKRDYNKDSIIDIKELDG